MLHLAKPNVRGGIILRKEILVMTKINFSISAAQGRIAHEHDNRDYTPQNADKSLRDRNITIKSTEDYKSAYNDLFRDSVVAHNAKQKREDRKKSFDYYSETENGKGHEKPIYEYVFQIGNRDDLGVTDSDFDYDKWVDLKKNYKFKTASSYVQQHLNKDSKREELKKILTDVMSSLEEKYPHFHFFTIQGHDDEPGGTLHFHVAFTPVADGYKNGMPVRNSLSKALSQMGFKTDKDGYGIQKWQNEVKDTIEKAMIQAGYERQYMNNTEKHLSVYQFKLKTANEKLSTENSVLESKNKLLQEQYEHLLSESNSLLSIVNMVAKKKGEVERHEAELSEREKSLNEIERKLKSFADELNKREEKLNKHNNSPVALKSDLSEKQFKLNNKSDNQNLKSMARITREHSSDKPYRRIPDICKAEVCQDDFEMDF